MALFGRGRNKSALTEVAEMMARGADVQTAFQFAIGGLDSEQRTKALLEMVRAMPPSMRAIVLGDTVLRMASDLEQAKTTLTERERRIEITNALIEEGRATKAVELGNIAAGTEVTLFLATPNHGSFPSFERYMGMRDRGAYPSGQLDLEARGRGEFITRGKACFHTGTGAFPGQTRRVDLHENTVFQVRSGHVRRESETSLRFGDLVLMREVTSSEPAGTDWETVRNLVQREDVALDPINVVYLSGIHLDGQDALYPGMFKD